MFRVAPTSNTEQTLPQYLDILGQNVVKRHPPTPSAPKQNPAANSLGLPAFIKPLPARFDSDDLDFLRSKGALTLPSRECQDALLWSFFEYVYPFMPILDLDQFLHSVEDADGKAGKISLLLFQAVLFTGTAHVPLHHLQNAGFTTRKNARKAFFQRVRLLYDFNTESDHLVLVQALLLMTLWYETPDEHRNTWHWIDVSISQAFTSGLNQDPSYFKSKYSPRMQRLRRRVWWVCFMRDRMVSLGMRRPPTIRDDDYNVSMLGESDFKPATGTQKARRDICSYRDDARKRHDLATLCVEKAKLCRCWRHYVRTHYTIFSENADDGGTGIYRVPRPDDKDVFATCNEDLLKWNTDLPESCKYLSPTCNTDNPGDNTVTLNRTILHMAYFAAIASLHRSRFTALLQDPKASLFEQELSKLSMQNAATHISSMAAAIHTSGMDIFLPTLAISVLVSAAVIHLLEVKGVIQADTKKAYQGYRRCMAVIESLKDMYVVANLAKDAMEWAFIEPMSNDHSSSHYTSSIADPCRSLAALRDSEVSSELYSATDATSPNLSLSGQSSMEEAISAVEQAWGDFSKAVKQDAMFDEAVVGERQGIQMEELEGFESCIMFSDLDP
ncbi:fungal-specific transcription factor domain-containing protein [Dactylonectria estremocensis]|uniref:Fungal-specific transcription factor domain-containing protein n=1 Tax=Dactylonectria estremocensis TaxID=1079267 RepID=A0A9P9IYA0_9HYPO|nr:fungal-specific transcription factor domain-containing protein [Dactylonectria estremocensis]